MNDEVAAESGMTEAPAADSDKQKAADPAPPNPETSTSDPEAETTAVPTNPGTPPTPGDTSMGSSTANGENPVGAATDSPDSIGAASERAHEATARAVSKTVSDLSRATNSLWKNQSTRMKGAVGNLLPQASLERLTERKYTLPDKTVASQVLMYRQLLHTQCKPGLRLSRQYQGTAAQKAVMHMPWWEQGVEQTKKMIISYDNLIVRLWLNGAIMPYTSGLFDPRSAAAEAVAAAASKKAGAEPTDEDESGTIDTMIDDRGLPPVPHAYWVDRLGFQQPDPVTDFRSGGVLSLAMLVHMTETCPSVHARFLPGGDAEVLPFGITCINVTNMLAKFLMLSKAVDRIDALLSSKPFWRMFADPNALLVSQELALGMLADVVVELGRERKIPAQPTPFKFPENIGGKREGYEQTEETEQEEANDDDKKSAVPSAEEENKATEEVTVFDFSEILERTERRVRDDLLGAGPRTVEEMRSIAGRLRVKYLRALERKEQTAVRLRERNEEAQKHAESIRIMTTEVMDKAGGIIQRIKTSQRTMALMDPENQAIGKKTSALAAAVASSFRLGPAGTQYGQEKDATTAKAEGTEGDKSEAAPGAKATDTVKETPSSASGNKETANAGDVPPPNPFANEKDEGEVDAFTIDDDE